MSKQKDNESKSFFRHHHNKHSGIFVIFLIFCAACLIVIGVEWLSHLHLEKEFTKLALDKLQTIARLEALAIKNRLIASPDSSISDIASQVHIGEKGYSWIVNEDGIILYHPNREHIGKNPSEIKKEAFPEHDWSDLEYDAIFKKMMDGQEGGGVYTSAWWTDDELKIVKKLAGFAPVRVNGRFFSVGVNIGYNEISDFTKRQAVRSFIVISVVILLAVVTMIFYYNTHLQKQLMSQDLQQFRRNQRILETSMDGFSVVSSDGKLLEVNSALCDITGNSKEELVGMKVSDIDNQRAPEQIAQQMDKVMSQGYDRFESKHRRKDGKIIDMEVSARYCELNGEKCFFTFSRDITERKQAEIMIAEKQENLEAIFTASPVGLLLIDETITITKINNVATILAGKNVQEAVGIRLGNALNCIHSFDKPEGCGHGSFCSECPIRNAVESVFKTGQSIYGAEVQVTLLIEQKPTNVWLEVCIEPLEIAGKKHALVAVSNITERKRIEAEREDYKEKVLNAQRHAYIGSMAAIVAHQVNQPLTKINILLDRAIEEIEERSCSPTVLKNVKGGLTEAQNAASIIRKFRQHSKGPALEDTGKVNVISVAYKIVSVLSERARNAQMLISIQDAGDLLEVETNEIVLEQIFLVIIQNAIDAADDGKSHKLDITGKFVDGNVELQFADDCGGIATENLDRIFEPFFSTKDKDKGMGLGLDIVQQILISFGGQVRVESRLGKGATFYITLPVSDSQGYKK